MGIVEISGDVMKQRKCTDSIVVIAAVVKSERVSSNGRVFCARTVEQQCCSANGGIGFSVVGGKGPGTNTSAKTSVAILGERVPTQRCISNAGGEIVKRVTPCPCVEIGRAFVRCRGTARAVGESAKQTSVSAMRTGRIVMFLD